MDSRKARTLPRPQMTIEAFVDVVVQDSAGSSYGPPVIVHGRVDADGSWVLAFHKASDPLCGDVLAGNEPAVAQMLVKFWTAVASVR